MHKYNEIHNKHQYIYDNQNNFGEGKNPSPKSHNEPNRTDTYEDCSHVSCGGFSARETTC